MGAEEFTVAEWLVVRNQLAGRDDLDEATSRLLTAAMDHLEHGWVVLAPLERWVEHRHPERERADDAYGFLLTFVEADLLDAFRTVAFNVMHLVREWPEFDRVTPDDVELSLFVRYVSVLRQATEGADVPDAFRDLVHGLAPLDPGAPWERELSATLAAIGADAQAEETSSLALSFVDVALRGLPGDQRGPMAEHVDSLYARAGLPSPAWLEVFRCRATGA